MGLLGRVVALCLTVVVLFLQAVSYVCEHHPGRCAEHGLKKAQGGSRGTSEEATVVSQVRMVAVWLSTAASQAESSGRVLGGF